MIFLFWGIATFQYFVGANECIFKSRPGVVNAAAELAVSAASKNAGGRWTLEYAPATIRPFPDSLLRDKDEHFYNGLLNRRLNSVSWHWSTVANEERQATGIAHIIFCPVEFWGNQGEDRHSLCSSLTTGNHGSKKKEDRCDIVASSVMLVGNAEFSQRPNRTGTTACWCETPCLKASGSYKNNSRIQAIDSYVVESEGGSALATKATVFEDNNNKNGTDWYNDNLINSNPPHGKGIFPRTTDHRKGLDGTVFTSLRLINVLEPFSKEDDCGNEGNQHAEPQIIRRSIGRVEEELVKALQTGIDTPLTNPPARKSSIALAVATSLGTVIAFYNQRKHPVIRHSISSAEAEAQVGLNKAKKILRIMSFAICEVGLELLPIYFLLREEISAKNHLQIHAYEVVNIGSQVGVYPLAFEDGVSYAEGTSAFMVVMLRNKNTSVVLIAIFATVLTVLSLFTVIRGVLNELRISRVSEAMLDEREESILKKASLSSLDDLFVVRRNEFGIVLQE